MMLIEKLELFEIMNKKKAERIVDRLIRHLLIIILCNYRSKSIYVLNKNDLSEAHIQTLESLVKSLVFTSSVIIIVVMMRLQYLLSKFLLAFVDISVELVAVLPDGELLVIIDRDVNLLWAHRLVLGVVELRYIWVTQGLFGGQAFVRVEMKQ